MLGVAYSSTKHSSCHQGSQQQHTNISDGVMCVCGGGHELAEIQQFILHTHTHTLVRVTNS